MQDLGVGIIGFGYIGKVHAYAYRTMGLLYDPPPLRTRLVAVATSRAETAEQARARGGFEAGAADWHEVIERPDVRIVNVCTPNDLHCPIVLAALAAGKHVYCDKPLALNLPEATEIASAARRAQVTHQMTFHLRFVPAIMRARQLLDDGFVGRVYHYRVSYLHCGYSDAKRPMSWRLDKARAGAGALADLGSHVIDLAEHLAGPITAVNASAETFVRQRPAARGSSRLVPVKVDDYVLLQARTADGALGVLEASRFATGTNDDLKVEVYGERGALAFDLMQPDYLLAYDDTEPGGDLGGCKGFKRIETVQRYPAPSALPGGKAPVGWMRFHVACLHNFLRHVAEGTAAEPDLVAGARVQAVMEATLESAREGTWRDVPTIA